MKHFYPLETFNLYTTMQGLKGIPTTRSQRATNMHLRAEYLRAKHGKVRLMLGSGTPITNTVAESYNLLRFIAPTALTKRGVGSFDAFAKTFTESVEKMEPGVTGEYKAQTRLAKFINVPELRALLGQGLDVVRARETGIVRPIADHALYQAGRAALGASPEAIREDNWQPLSESTGERLARLKQESQASLFAPDQAQGTDSGKAPEAAPRDGKFDDKRDFATVAAELTALEEQRETAAAQNETGLTSGATGKSKKEKWAITLEGVVIHDKDRAAFILDQALAAIRPLEEKIVGNYLGFDLKVAAVRSNFGNTFKPQLSFS